jgi:hypothetical protein
VFSELHAQLKQSVNSGSLLLLLLLQPVRERA